MRRSTVIISAVILGASATAHVRAGVPCAVIGDSLAVGIGAWAPACAVAAKVGIRSSSFARAHPEPVEAEVVVISLGANDSAADQTLSSLAAVRTTVRARQVWWILPSKPAASRRVIAAIAGALGDHSVDTGAVVGSDGLHLTGEGYRAIAVLTLGAHEAKPARSALER